MRYLMLLLALAVPVRPAQAGCYSCGHVNRVSYVQKAVFNPIYVQQVAVPIYAPDSYYRVGSEYQLKSVVQAVVQEMQLQINSQPVIMQPAPQVSGWAQQQAKQIMQAPPQPVRAAVTTGCSCAVCQCKPAPAAPPAADCPTGHCPAPNTPVQPPANPPANPPAQPPAQPGGELAAQVLKIFLDSRPIGEADPKKRSKSCAECHGKTEELSGHVRLVNVDANGNYALADVDHGTRGLVYFKTSTGAMPPSVLKDAANPHYEHMLSDAEMSTLAAWVRDQ